MTEWQTLTAGLVILPVGQPIFSEMSTTISLEDEGDGPFIKIEQADLHKTVHITAEEWPHIRAAVENQLRVAALLDSQEPDSQDADFERVGGTD